VRTVAGLKAGISVDEAQRHLAKSFALAGIESGMTDARALIGAALRLSRAQLLAQSDRLLEPREIATIDALAARRLKREPVSRILGRKEFWSLMLDVTPDVLVPRPDTETLIEVAQDRLGDAAAVRIADVGTGSGAIAVTLAKLHPDATVFAVDVSEDALAVARANAVRHTAAVTFLFGDLDAPLAAHGPFTLVAANLPYIPTGDLAGLAPEVKVEPALALDGGPDGLAIVRRLVTAAPGLLASGGALVMEIGDGQAAATAALLRAAGLTDVQTKRDLGGVERVVSGVKP
jgi:release factor glutamine methyltransferase